MLRHKDTTIVSEIKGFFYLTTKNRFGHFIHFEFFEIFRQKLRLFNRL